MKLFQLFHKPAAKDPLDASAIPEGRGIRSLNNLPLIIGSVFIAVFLGIVAHVMMQRSEERAQQEQEQAQKQGTSAANQAGEVTGPWGNGGLIPPNAPKKKTCPRKLRLPCSRNYSSRTFPPLRAPRQRQSLYGQSARKNRRCGMHGFRLSRLVCAPRPECNCRNRAAKPPGDRKSSVQRI